MEVTQFRNIIYIILLYLDVQWIRERKGEE